MNKVVYRIGYRYRQIFLIHYRLSEYRLNSISVHHCIQHSLRQRCDFKTNIALPLRPLHFSFTFCSTFLFLAFTVTLLKTSSALAKAFIDFSTQHKHNRIGCSWHKGKAEYMHNQSTIWVDTEVMCNFEKGEVNKMIIGSS